MTNLIAWLAANWAIFAIILTYLILLIAIGIWSLGWYLWKWMIGAFRPDTAADESLFGDVPHVPKEGRRRAA